MERRTLPGGPTVLVSPEMDGAGFFVAFTERTGGRSNGRFESLNLGLVSGDDRDSVIINREALCAAMGISPFASGQQVHRTTIATAGPEAAGRGFRDPSGAFPATDGLMTDVPGLPLCVLTADCVPLALGDPATGRLVLVHAGWRGIAGSILAAAVGLFPEPLRVSAAIGPAVCMDHYEVGEEVVAAVADGTDGAAAVRRAQGGHSHLDLPATVDRVLRRAGVRRVDQAAACTVEAAERFYSYRRDGKTGLQGLVGLRM
jgi:polyphenol oxidase